MDETDHEHEKRLRLAFERALAFPITRATSLRLTPEKAQDLAQLEAQFGAIHTDERGMSGGLKTQVEHPIRAVQADWRMTRADFDTQVQPKLVDILAAEEAKRKLDEAEQQRVRELQSIERNLEANQNYMKKRVEKDNAQRYWKNLNDIHSGRAATMFARTTWYVLIMLCIGVAEWFINYNVLLMFTGVPAIAAGTTIILGVLLAFAAHAHGELFRQWSYRFSESREPAQRARDWRLFALSTFSLLIVLGASGFARMQAALHALAEEASHNLLSNLPGGDINPIRDVLISMLANIAAWTVGVFIAYFSHDDDPEYMEATYNWNKTHKAWAQYHAGSEKSKRHIQAKFMKKIADLQATVETRVASVKNELNMLRQVNSHEEALNTELEQVTLANTAMYKEALARVVLNSGGRIKIIGPTGATLSPFEYRAMGLSMAKELRE